MIHDCQSISVDVHGSWGAVPGTECPLAYIRVVLIIMQYVGGTDNTVPFDGAPSAVVKARDLIHSRMLSVMQAESGQYCFNEVLSAAYMEKQKMAVRSLATVATQMVS